MKMKKSDIVITVGTDENNVPCEIVWKAKDNPSGPKNAECKAFILSLFEKDTQETLRIDLWTKEMQVAEMDRFIFATLKGISDTYYKATNNANLANDMQKFVQYFGEKTEILKPE